jgi:ribosome-interacting GTPase 1
LDLPGIIEGAAGGRGRGRQVISTARTCNLILVVLDAGKPVTHKKIIEQELFSFGIRINQGPPDIKFVKKEQGGIGYQEAVPQTKGMNAEVARLVCREYKISCGEIILREDVTVDQFIDVLEANRAYIPVLYVFNKIDSITIEELDILDQMPVSPSYFFACSVWAINARKASELDCGTSCTNTVCVLLSPKNYVPISSQHKWNLEVSSAYCPENEPSLRYIGVPTSTQTVTTVPRLCFCMIDRN